jgi:hexosaminidase
MDSSLCSAKLNAAFSRYKQRIFAPIAAKRGYTSTTTDTKALTDLKIQVTALDQPGYVITTSQDESYELHVGESAATLSAKTETGILRGLETFSQLIKYETESSVPILKVYNTPISICDSPRYKWRAYKIDTSRHFIPVSALKQTLDAMEIAKMNALFWHVIDGPSFPLESKRYPKLAQEGAYSPDAMYSQEDVKEVEAYAQARGIRLIPELDIPGHSGFQYGYPEIVACPSWTDGDGSNRALDVTLNETYTFLSDWLDEMAGLFQDPAINVYGDEVRFECWEQKPAIAEWMSAHGMKRGDYQSLVRYFWQRFTSSVW